MSIKGTTQKERRFEQTLDDLRRQFHDQVADVTEQAHTHQREEQQRLQDRLTKQHSTSSVKFYIPMVPSLRQQETMPGELLSPDELRAQDVISASTVYTINNCSDTVAVGFRQPETSPWYGISLPPGSSYTLPLSEGQWEVAAYTSQGVLLVDDLVNIVAGLQPFFIAFCGGQH